MMKYVKKELSRSLTICLKKKKSSTMKQNSDNCQHIHTNKLVQTVQFASSRNFYHCIKARNIFYGKFIGIITECTKNDCLGLNK